MKTLPEVLPGSQILEEAYKSNAMLIIRQNPEDKFPFQFGVRKAHLIVKYMDQIRAFAEKHPLPEAK